MKKLARINNKGYSQAGASHKKSSLQGFHASSGPAVEDIDYNNYTLRQRSRILYMAQPLATSAIRTQRTNAIGEGLQLKSKIDRSVLGLTTEQADEWQKKTEREFLLWAEDKSACDATGMNDFFEMQQLALISWLSSGDVFAVMKNRSPTAWQPYSTAIHLIEADRISTPYSQKMIFVAGHTEGVNAKNGNKIHDGIEVDPDGRVVAYWISDQYPNQINATTANWTRLEAVGKSTGLPNVLQIMESERPDQYRGVPYLAQVIEPLLQLRRYTESELMAALVESYYTAWITTSGRTDEPLYNEALPGDEAREIDASETDDDVAGLPNPDDFRMGPGTTHVLGTGEDVKFGDPKRPASGFPSFVRAIAEQAGAALEIPADLLLKSFNASYSASRGALLEAWKAFRMRRKWFANDFCKPIYQAWLTEAIALGRIQAPGYFTDPAIRKAWSGSEWNGPSQGQLSPVQEIQAEVLACQNGFSTREQSTVRLNGGDFSRNVETMAKETASMNEILGGNNE